MHGDKDHVIPYTISKKLADTYPHKIRYELFSQSVAANTIDRSKESTNQEQNNTQQVQEEKADDGLDK